METSVKNTIGRDESTASQTGFFGRAVLLLLLLATTVLGLGYLIGRAYHPQPLTASPSRVNASARFVTILGNSRAEAGVDPKRLSELLTRQGHTVDVQAFTGGGWDMLHYYMLALLASQSLRPHRDAVMIEVSPYSLDDTATANRLGVIRPETALQLASLPGEPIETRLDILMGSVAGLYRYRLAVHWVLLQPRLAMRANQVGDLFERWRLLRPPPSKPAFELITAPGRGFVIERIEGDREVFRDVNRKQIARAVSVVRVGGFKLRALERAVQALRAHAIDVYLLQFPTSRWFDEKVNASPGGAAYGEALPRLAAATGATLLDEWPASFYEETKFWDDLHMVASSTMAFTEALAEFLKTRDTTF